MSTLPPARACLAGLLVAGVLGSLVALAPRPLVDNAVDAWFPSRDPRIQDLRAFQARFGADEVVVVELRGDSLTEVVRLAEEVELALAEQAGVARVIGPAQAFSTELQILGDPELARDGMQFVAWAFQGPLNHSLNLLRPDLPAARVLAVLAPADAATRAAFARRLDALREEARAAGVGLRVAGQPLVNLELDRAGAEVETRSMPWLVGASVLLLLLLTRSARRSLALLAPVGLCVLALDGVLGLCGASSNLIVAIVKPLTFVILLATGYHLLVAYEDLRRAGAGGWSAARQAVRAKATACALALSTTAVGFGSLATSDIVPIRTFGWASAVGLLLLGLPALLVLLPLLLAGSGAPRSSAPSRVGGFVAALVAGSARRWPLVLALGLGVVLAGALGATRLSPQPHAIHYLAADHPLRRDHDALEADGLPLAQLEVVLEGTAPIASDAALLARVDAWARRVEALPAIHAHASLLMILREAGYRSARRDALPAQSIVADVLRAHPEEVAPYVAREGRALRFSLGIETLAPEQLAALEREIREAFDEELAGQGLHLNLTGTYALLLSTQRSLLLTMRNSLLMTAVLMQAVLLVFLGSLRLALAALLPNALPVAAVFALLGALSIPVDVGTAMVSAIALGIAVDDTLHLLYAWKHQGLERAARGTARAILLSSLVIAAGFLAITPSPFLPTRSFGALCAAAMLVALAGDLILLPACLRALRCQPNAQPSPARPAAEHAPMSG
ncbi:MAG: MMPL family transporter [Planctomycetes bacterium]|nr:MMPL family transporter [Planctomycetota bacterium]